jgi:uracil-DNA glycosylase family 4
VAAADPAARRELAADGPGADPEALVASPSSAIGIDAATRRRELIAFARELADCQKCPLAGGRTQVVFGTGTANADLMFVGEAPGFHEDRLGKPFVGPAGKLLDRLLAEIGLNRRQCFIANVLKCRPPGNRDPQGEEIEACKGHLFKQIELIQPRVVCTLGNFATKLLSGQPQGISRVRGVPQVRELAGTSVFLYPIFHPAAALRTAAMLERLRQDFAKIPELLDQPRPQLARSERPVPPPVPEPTPPPIPEPTPPPIPEPSPEPVPEPAPPAPELVRVGSDSEADTQQLGLF